MGRAGSSCNDPDTPSSFSASALRQTSGRRRPYSPSWSARVVAVWGCAVSPTDAAELRRNLRLDPFSVGAMGRSATWLAGNDTGASSKTMLLIAMGANEGSWSAPVDVGDFGRCQRMLERIPEVKAYFPLIRALCPAFTHLMSEWNTLERLSSAGLLASAQVSNLERAGCLSSETGGES